MYKIFLILWLIPSLVFSQGGFHVTKGKILDKNTLEPLPQAYICIPTTGYGTAPNSDGDFIFQFPNINLDSIVVVSLIGYQSISFKANTLKSDGNILELQPIPLFDASYGLSDVRIMLKAAIDSIPANYSNTPVYQNGFYQEQINLPSIGAIKVNEAVLRIERYPEGKEKFEKVKLLRGRRLEWAGQTSKTEGWGFQNGSEIVCRSLETAVPEFLQKKQMSQYDFRLDSLMTNFDGLPLFIIHFWSLNKRVKGGKEGTIFLDPESKAIVRIEYSLTQEGIKDLINSNTGPVKIEGKSVKYYTQYRQFQSKWRLQESSIVFVSKFEEKLDKKFKIEATIKMRYVAFENLPLIKSNIFTNEILTSTNNFNVSKSLSTEFWSPYNFLKSTQDAENLSKYLNKH
jgi:hypothetical protein